MSNAAYATSPDAVRELDADAVTARLKYVPNAPQDLELAFIARGGSSSRLVPMPGMNIQPEDLVDAAVAIGDVMPVTVGDVVAVGEKKGIAKLLMPGYCACTLARHRRAVASTVGVRRRGFAYARLAARTLAPAAACRISLLVC